MKKTKTPNEAEHVTVIVLDVNGESRTVECPTTLEGWQGLVGEHGERGYIEALRVSRTTTLLVNEDGLSLGMEHNEVASSIARRPLVGPVVVLQGASLARWEAP